MSGDGQYGTRRTFVGSFPPGTLQGEAQRGRIQCSCPRRPLGERFRLGDGHVELQAVKSNPEGLVDRGTL
jgi:hypothetical protein